MKTTGKVNDFGETHHFPKKKKPFTFPSEGLRANAKVSVSALGSNLFAH